MQHNLNNAGESQAIALRAFPKELYRGAFKYPDWRFLTIFVSCAILSGIIVLLLSRREISDMTSRQEIVEIQDRYARIVLNLPGKTVRKMKESPRAGKVEKKKGAREIEEVEIKRKVEPKPLVTEEEIKSMLQEEIGEIIAQGAIVEELMPVMDIAPQLPELEETLAYSKYDTRDRSFGALPEIEEREDISVATTMSEIDIGASRQYDYKSSAAVIDLADSEKIVLDRDVKSPDIKTSKRYNLPRESKISPIPLMDMKKRDMPETVVAAKVPDLRTRTPRRRVITGRGGISKMPAMELRTKRIERSAPVTPDLQTVQSDRYGKKSAAGRSHLSSTVNDLPVEGKTSMFSVKDLTRRQGAVNKGQTVPDIRSRLSGKLSSKTAIKKVEPPIRKTVEKDPVAVKAPVAEKVSVEGTEVARRYHLPETATVHNLTACVDPTEEKRLKRKILAFINEDIYYCEDNYGKFAFYNMELLTTFDVRFISYNNGEDNRCDALKMALQCLHKKIKR